MDFNSSYIFMENLLGDRDFKTDVRTIVRTFTFLKNAQGRCGIWKREKNNCNSFF